MCVCPLTRSCVCVCCERELLLLQQVVGGPDSCCLTAVALTAVALTAVALTPVALTAVA